MSQDSWITDERVENAGFPKRFNLAEEFGVTTNTLLNWGVGKTEEKAINFEKFSEIFKEPEELLRQQYRKIRKANGNDKKPKLGEVSKSQLLQSIEACHSQCILTNVPKCKGDPKKLYTLIIDDLEKGRMDFKTQINSTLNRDIQVANENQLTALRKFVSEVAKAVIVIDEKNIAGGKKHRLLGNAPFWLIRLIIDSTQDLDPNRSDFDFCNDITVGNNQFHRGSVPHFDASPKVIGGEELTIYNFVESLNKYFVWRNDPPPNISQDKIGFGNYCRAFNAHLENTNPTDVHKFCMIPKEFSTDLISQLLIYFTDLRLYEVEESDEAESDYMRVEVHRLGDWLILNLGAINDRQNEMPLNAASRPQQNQEDKKMQNINVTVDVKPEINITQNNSNQWQEFNQAFEALTKNVQQIGQGQDYRELKNTLRNIEDEIKENGSVPKEASSWIDKSFSAISRTNSTWGLAEKTMKAIDALNGAGVL